MKFAVKEIKVRSGTSAATAKGEPEQKLSPDRAYGLAANAPGKSQIDDESAEDLEEYEEVESILESSNMDDTSSEEVPRCRFCWDTKASLENPLFSTCKCSGSVGYIHFDCLRGWLDVKKQMKTSPCFSSYFWKSFECEICKKAYPLVLRTKCPTAKSGYITYNLVDYERPEGDFLVLESLN